MTNKIAILGSTGSIGKSTLKIIRRDKTKFNIKLLSTNSNIKKLYHQCKEFNVNSVIIKNKAAFRKYEKEFKKKKIKVYFDFLNLKNIFSSKKVDFTINAISGIDGLEPTLNSIKFSKNILIANKESIICGWNLINKKLKYYNTNFIPIDSEHFSIWELMRNEDIKNINKIYITASGGPFLNKNINYIKKAKAKTALKHPKWKMGKKISIDSATMMNKVFEIIEAHKIFNVDYKKLGIIIHPNSYIHAIIHFKNGLVKLLAHNTSMEIPIANALYFKKNYELAQNNLSINDLDKLQFYNINPQKFKLLKILKYIPKKYSFFETILVSLNDELVHLYLNNKINFLSIETIILKIIKHKYFINRYGNKYPNDTNQIKDMIESTKLYLKKYLKENDYL